MIKKLFDKCVDWAGRKYANFALAIISFIESSFFPIPPDVMIIPMVIAKKQHFVKIALIATTFSVLGGLFGYLIGYIFFNEIGFKIFEIYGYENVDVLKDMFSTKGGMLSWFGLLFTAGFTPLPFKILTITSGFIHYNIFVFILTCVVTRGLRFFLVAFLTNKFGLKIGPFLEKKAAKWTFIIAGIVILLCIGFYFLIINK
jgi:membrane protein YqaA with SNARE-associated domain